MQDYAMVEYRNLLRIEAIILKQRTKNQVQPRSVGTQPL